MRVVAAAELRFEPGHEMNGWLSLSHVIDGARVRLEALTSAIAEDLPEEFATLRTRLLGQLNAAHNAAGEISTCYWTVEDMKRRGQPEPLDADRVKTRRTRFGEAARGGCESVDELGRLIAPRP